MNKEYKKSKNKGKSKVSFRAMIIAMIVALLSFLGFGGFELGNGDGADTDSGQNSGLVSEKDNSQDQSTDEVEKGSDEADLASYSIYVREDKLFVTMTGGADELEEVTLDKVKETLATLSSDMVVIIYDDAAVDKTYQEVMSLVNETGLRKIEDIVTK